MRTSLKLIMKIITSICLLFIFVAAKGEDSEFDANLNRILSPVFACFKQRVGVKCPSKSDCPAGSKFQCANTTQCCVSSSKPLVRFYLFTPKNKDNPEFLHECGGSLPENTLFDKNLDTEIFIHGLFDGPCRTAIWREMKIQLFFRGNYNVILVDWSRLNFPDIADALNANKYVGGRVACVIQNIMKQTGIKGNKVHLVGHSMGSHISGFAGQYINQCGDKLRRITALDPSNFGYYGYRPNERLSRDDAKYVDAIHTNIGDCFPAYIGYPEDIAHADFYPNGGVIQRSCHITQIESFLKSDVLIGLITFLPSFCYHVQAEHFYKVSINPCKCQFVGVWCENYEKFKSGECRSCGQNGSKCAVMGMDSENYYRGSSELNGFYLSTSNLCPYCDNSNIDLGGFFENSPKNNLGLHCFEKKAKK